MKKYVLLLGFVFILVIAVLMYLAKQKKESSVFDRTCSAPCWRNITPGQTTVDEAHKLISGFLDEKTNNLNLAGPYDVFSGYYAFGLSGGTVIRVYFIDNVAALIVMTNDNGITAFRNCIKEFGTPEFATQSFYSSFGLPIGPTQSEHIWFTALNPKKGVTFGFDTYTYFGPLKSVSQGSNVTIINYFDTAYYDTLLRAGWLFASDTDYNEEDLHLWVGYGNISELYPADK